MAVYIIKGLDVSSRISVTRQIEDPAPLIKKSMESCPGGRSCTKAFTSHKVRVACGSQILLVNKLDRIQ